MKQIIFEYNTNQNLEQTFKDKILNIKGKPSKLNIILKQNKAVYLRYFENENKDTYLISVNCNNDHILEKLGKQRERFPRGFFILYEPNRYLKFYGFLPKFENDDKKQIREHIQTESLSLSKKYSGSLGILYAWKDKNGLIQWTTTSKKSTCNTFSNEFAILLEKYYNDKNDFDLLMSYLANEGICLSAEICSSELDQSHGSKVIKSSFIITCVAYSSIIDLSSGKEINESDIRFVSYFSDDELIKFCHHFKLPVGNRYIINGKRNCQEIWNKLQDNRDLMTNSKFDKFVMDNQDKIKIIKGNINHQEILGDTLEGLVIFSGKKKIFKWKLPQYTSRTFGIRKYIQKYGLNLNKQEYEEHVNNYVEHWCISNDGKKYWKNILMNLRQNIHSNDIDIIDINDFINKGHHIDLFD